MSDLIAIAYNDLATATKVREEVFDLQRERLITIEDIVVVERRSDGKIKLHQARNLAGAASDIGVDDRFMRELGQQLRPGAAAVFILVAEATPDRVIPELTKFGGRLIKTSLSNEAEQHLRKAAKSAREQGAPVGASADRT